MKNWIIKQLGGYTAKEMDIRISKEKTLGVFRNWTRSYYKGDMKKPYSKLLRWTQASIQKHKNDLAAFISHNHPQD